MLEKIRISDMALEELLSLFFCEIGDNDDFYDVIAYNLAKSYGRQIEGMLECLSNSRLRALITGIGMASPSDERYSEIIAPYRDHPDPLVAAAAIDALRYIGLTEWPDIEPALRHSSAFVRGAALRFARSKLEAGSVPILIKGLRDGHDIVRQNALDELAGVATSKDIPDIASCLDDPSIEVQQAARTLLSSLSA